LCGRACRKLCAAAANQNRSAAALGRHLGAVCSPRRRTQGGLAVCRWYECHLHRTFFHRHRLHTKKKPCFQLQRTVAALGDGGLGRVQREEGEARTKETVGWEECLREERSPN